MIAIIKNVKEEGPGNLEDFLLKNSLPYRIFEAEEGDFPRDLNYYQGLVVLGGPMGVYEMDKYPHLHTVSEIIRTAIEKNLKVLGICLGAQLIAHVLGARVYKGYAQEIGWLEIELTEEGLKDPSFLSLAKNPLLNKINRKFKVFHWHGDTFDLPFGCIHLAKSSKYKNQAFRYKENVYALQFHIEITKDLLKKWFEDHPLREEILKEAEELMPEYSERAKNFYHTFWKKEFT